MSIPRPPTSELDRAVERSKQAMGLKIVIGFLLIAALVVGVFVRAIPLPVRLFVAATDVIAAAVIYLVLRQKFRDM